MQGCTVSGGEPERENRQTRSLLIAEQLNAGYGPQRIESSAGKRGLGLKQTHALHRALHGEGQRRADVAQEVRCSRFLAGGEIGQVVMRGRADEAYRATTGLGRAVWDASGAADQQNARSPGPAGERAMAENG